MDKLGTSSLLCKRTSHGMGDTAPSNKKHCYTIRYSNKADRCIRYMGRESKKEKEFVCCPLVVLQRRSGGIKRISHMHAGLRHQAPVAGPAQEAATAASNTERFSCLFPPFLPSRAGG